MTTPDADAPSHERSGTFVRGLGVLAGWYAAVAVVAAVWIALLPADPPPEPCTMWCLSEQHAALFMVSYIGIAYLLPVSLLIAIPTLTLMSTVWRRSWLAAGNVAALLGLVGGALVVVLLLRAG